MKKTQRSKLITLIHVAKSKLLLDEETYRDLLEQTTGKRSTTEMNQAQLSAVLDHLKQAGFKVKARTGVENLASDAQSKLIRHLWLSLYHAGKVRNSSELALAAFVKKQTGVSALQFLSTHSAGKVIENLKKWCARSGVEFERS